MGDLFRQRYLLAISFILFPISAKGTAAQHLGKVESGGFPVPGATVTLARDHRLLVTITDAQGAYAFSDIEEGAWRITVELPCFKTIVELVDIEPASPPLLWRMELLSFDEVKALAGRGSIDADAAAETARPAVEAATLSADLKPTPLPETSPLEKSAAEEEAQSASGQESAAPEVLAISGSSNNGGASAVAQDPAFGNYRRAKTGQYHGNFGFTGTNSILDARPFSLTGQDTPKPSVSSLRTFASFGGPLVIPHLLPVRTNNIEFFVNYQWSRNRDARTFASLMPTPAEREGDLSQVLTAQGQPAKVLDPTNGLPFAGNEIPIGRISPQARFLLGLYPLPTSAVIVGYNYQASRVNASGQQSIQTRLSKTLDRSNQIYGVFGHRENHSDTPNLFNFLDTSQGSAINGTLNWQHMFGRRWSTTFQYRFARVVSRVTPYFANRQNVSSQAGISGNDQGDPLNWGPPTLSFSGGIASLSDAQESLARNQTSWFSVPTTLERGSHSIAFGAGLRRQHLDSLSQQNARGNFVFNGAATGLDVADFLLGIPDTSSVAFGNADKYFQNTVYDIYLRDNWRIRPGITLNVGMRWEYTSPLTELYGRLVNLDVTPGFSAESPVLASHPVGILTGQSYPDSLVNPDKRGLEPRIGVAWRPFPASSLVLRAGYGINRDTEGYQWIAAQMAQQSPLSRSLSVQNTPANPLTLADGFIASPEISPDTFGVDPRFRVGYAQTWQASAQRDLIGSLVLTITYLGIKGTRAAQEFLPNTYPAGALSPCSQCPTGFAYLASNGNSTRESGQIQLRRRMHNGFGATVQYTLAKSIDDATLGGGLATPVIAQNWLDLSGERGRSGFDQRNLATLTFQYSTGMGVAGGMLLRGWKGAAFKHWTITTAIKAGSGLPLTPIYLAAVSGTGFTGSIRPDYTGAALYAAPPGLHLNPAAFQAPQSGEWGNAGRNIITGPGQFGLDAAMQRTFRVKDRNNVDLRLESTNLLNHVTFAGWNTTFTSNQFGLPTTANPMRTVQLTLRARF